MAHLFLRSAARRMKKDVRGLSAEAMALLMSYRWPGNVRELENTLERSVLMNACQVLLPEHLVFDEPISSRVDAPSAVLSGQTVHDMEKTLIFDTLRSVDDNRTQAAKLLGISIRTLRNKLKLYQESG